MVHDAGARAGAALSVEASAMSHELDRTLAALADPARRAMIDLLRVRPYRSSDLADALCMSRPAVSRHLRVLRQAGLIEQDVLGEDARVRMVHLRRDRFAELRGWIEAVEAVWCDRLQSFRAHVGAGGARARSSGERA